MADTQPLFSECLAAALRMQADFEVLGERPNSGPSAVTAALNHRPDVLVVDYWISEMAGPAATAVVSSRTSVSVIVLGWLFGPREIRTAFAAGASAFIPKTLGVKDLASAVRRVGAGERLVLPDDFGSSPVSPAALADETKFWGRLASLTEREMEILRLLGMGLSKAKIASVVSMSPDTARTHIANIRRKLDARTQVEAVAIARQYGFIPL